MAHGPSCSAACGIFLDQGSNPCPLHWQADSQPLRHQGSSGFCFFDIELHELLVALFANIFSHPERCLFVLFMVSFAAQNLLSFIRSHLFIFVFISISLGGVSKRILL